MEILDLIYQVFEELEKAKEDQNTEMIEEKNRELDDLRVMLSKSLSVQGVTEKRICCLTEKNFPPGRLSI